jgi:hypothetical protein
MKPDVTSAEKVKKLLEKQGYPFEMFVAKAFLDEGLDIVSAEYFIDKDSGEYREIDLHSYFQWTSKKICYSIRFIIECKVSKEKPWVICRTDPEADGDYMLIHCHGDKLGDELLAKYNFDEELMGLPIISKKHNAGNTLVEIHEEKGKPSMAYAALQKVSKALYSHIADRPYTHSAGRDLCEIYIPVIALDGNLFEAHLETDLVVNTVASGVITWHYPINERLTVVHVVTKEGISDFIRTAKRTADVLFKKIRKDESIEPYLLKRLTKDSENASMKNRKKLKKK